MRAELTGSPSGYSPLKNDSCRCWWKPGHTAAMGRVVDYAADPIPITTIPNYLDPLGIDGGTFDAAGAARPLFAHLESSNIAREVAAFDNVNSDHASSLAAAAWTEAQQVWTWGIAARITAVGSNALCATQTANPAQTGCWISADGTNQQLDVRVGNGTGVWVINAVTGANTLLLNDVVVILIRYSQAFGYDLRINKVSLVNGALVGVVGVGAPFGTLHIGSDPVANRAAGNICEVAGFNEVLGVAAGDAGDELEDYLIAEYQDNSVAVQEAPTFFFRMGARDAFTLDEVNPAAGEQALFLWDQGGNAHRGYQATDANQGTVQRVDSLVDDEDSIETDGTSDLYVLSAGIGWPAGTDHSFIAIINQEDSLGTADSLFTVSAGILGFETLTNFARVGFHDGIAHRNCGFPRTGPQQLEWHLDDAANIGSVYRSGVLNDTAVYGAARVLGGNAILMAWHTSAGLWFDGHTAEAWHRDSLLTGVNLYNYREEQFELYPQAWGIVPGGEAWWNPLVEGNVQKDAANDVSQLNDTTYRGNDETQAVAADQPEWVADAGDGSPALSFEHVNTEYLVTGLVANAASGTLWGWFKKDLAINAQVMIGSIDGASDDCFLHAQHNANWVAAIGTTNPLDSGVLVVGGDWVFMALTWDGTNETLYVNDTWVTQAVGETASTRALVTGALDNNGSIEGHFSGDIGEHGVENFALDPYEIARLRRQTARGGNRDTWIAVLIPDHVLWCNPNWGEVVTRIAGDRVTVVQDGHASVNSGLQNNETQGVAADRPIWVADGGDGVPALRLVAATTEYLITGLVPNATVGTVWGWFKKTTNTNTRIAIGSRDAAGDRCSIYGAHLGNWRGGIGASIMDSGVAVVGNAWTFVALTWDGVNETLYVDGVQVVQAVGETASTRALTVGVYDNNGVLAQYWDGDIGEHGFIDGSALTLTQLNRLRAMTART